MFLGKYRNAEKCSKINAFPASSSKNRKSLKSFLGNKFVFGNWFFIFGRCFWGMFDNKESEVFRMRKKNYKGRCEKRSISKCNEVCRTYDAIQYAYADILQANKNITEIRCNVPLDGEEYTSDFVCTKSNGDLLVRECVNRKFLTKPLTVKMLDISRAYWLCRGVTDWGLVVNED